jgi:DNA-binding NarL/FixJ family response regulator
VFSPWFASRTVRKLDAETMTSASAIGGTDALIGRESELEALGRALAEADRGRGSLVMLSGDAGLGKTALAGATAADSGGIVMRGAAHRAGTPPHGPVVEALRSRLRADPKALAEAGSLLPHLALVMPELGEAPAASDQPTIFEAFRGALAAVSASETAVVILDDLHWSDDATLDLLAYLAAPLSEMSIVVIGVYRSDELQRDHPLRRLRTELRRGGTLTEVELEPLDPRQTKALAERILGGPVAGSLARTIHDRTQGIPFFVEEVTHALAGSDRLREGRRGFELGGGEDVPVPETIRDAVLMRASSLSSGGREAAEVAAVAGEGFALDQVAALSSSEGLSELVEGNLVLEDADGRGEFRHALVRDAIYADVPWLRRSELHRAFAERLTAAKAPSWAIANHWLGAREEVLARDALMTAVEEFGAVHAYRDAKRAGRRALELWDPAEDVAARLEALERYAACAELAGERGEAARAWRDVVEIRRSESDPLRMGEAQRRLAGIYALDGDRVRARDARRLAADAYAEAGLVDQAAADRLVAAGYLTQAGDHSEAIDVVRRARKEAEQVGRLDLQAEAMGIEGVALAKRGDPDQGMELARSGLSLALEHGLTASAGSLYQRLGTVHEQAADYGAAVEAMETAIGLCNSAGADDKERVCFECMAYLLRELGDWERAKELCLQLEADGTTGPGAGVVIDGVRGSIEGFRGHAAPARRLLTASLESAIKSDLLSMQIDCSAALAWVADSTGDVDTAASHARFLLQRWERSEDHHFAVWGLRWASSFFARCRDGEQARACAEALGRISAGGGYPDALAALAHALAESALLDDEAEIAAEHANRAVELHRSLDIPYERAEVSLRAGAILAAAGEREQALERLVDAHRIARKLGARPLATAAASEVEALGESVEKRLGKRAAAERDGAGLSRRELEVMRLVAAGRTNKEVAEELFLSPRTIDMHVRNILSKFGSRSRTEATARARELGLLDG